MPKNPVEVLTKSNEEVKKAAEAAKAEDELAVPEFINAMRAPVVEKAPVAEPVVEEAPQPAPAKKKADPFDDILSMFRDRK